MSRPAGQRGQQKAGQYCRDHSEQKQVAMPIAGGDCGCAEGLDSKRRWQPASGTKDGIDCGQEKKRPKRQMRWLWFEGVGVAVGGHRIRPFEPCGNVPASHRAHWVETQERTSIRAIGSTIELIFAPAQTSSRRIWLSWRLFSKQPDPNDFWFLAWDVTIQARVNCARPQVRQIATGEEDMKHDLPEDSAGEMANAVARLSGLIKQARLDCECRSELDETLSRFATLEIGAAAREHLTNARHQRAHIETILLFLLVLNDLRPRRLRDLRSDNPTGPVTGPVPFCRFRPAIRAAQAGDKST